MSEQTQRIPAVVHTMPARQTIRRDSFFFLATEELERAYRKHGRDLWGRHEFYGVVKEEFEEMWEAIKSDQPSDVFLREAAQVVAMILRYCETGNRYGGEL